MPDAAKPLGIDEVHIRRFARRAAWLRRAAYFILFVIFLLILAGALVYQQAGVIAAREVGTSDATHSSLDQLQTTKQTLEKEIELLTETRDAYAQQFEVGQRTLLEVLDVESNLSTLKGRYDLLLVKIKDFTKTGEPVNINSISTLEELTAARNNALEFSKFVEQITDTLERRLEAGVGSRADLTQAKQRLQGVTGNLQLLNQRIDSFVPKRELSAEAAAPELPIIIQTNITRFGTLIVIFFFIAILVPIYRYNIQSAAFYDAVSDALLLIRDTGDGDIASLVGVLTPSVNFSKSPATPIEQSVELVKALARSQPK